MQLSVSVHVRRLNVVLTAIFCRPACEAAEEPSTDMGTHETGATDDGGARDGNPSEPQPDEEIELINEEAIYHLVIMM